MFIAADLIVINWVLLELYLRLYDIVNSYDRIVQSAVEEGKYGGFDSLIGQTVDRLFIETLQNSNHDNGSVSVGPPLAVFGLDVSDKGESLYIYRKIMRKRKFPYKTLIVDIGANDGLLASNSRLFIRCGWDAILVEPMRLQLELAKQNNKRYPSAHGFLQIASILKEFFICHKSECVGKYFNHTCYSIIATNLSGMFLLC